MQVHTENFVQRHLHVGNVTWILLLWICLGQIRKNELATYCSFNSLFVRILWVIDLFWLLLLSLQHLLFQCILWRKMGSLWVWIVEIADRNGRYWMLHGLLCPCGRTCRFQIHCSYWSCYRDPLCCWSSSSGHGSLSSTRLENSSNFSPSTSFRYFYQP